MLFKFGPYCGGGGIVDSMMLSFELNWIAPRFQERKESWSRLTGRKSPRKSAFKTDFAWTTIIREIAVWGETSACEKGRSCNQLPLRKIFLKKSKVEGYIKPPNQPCVLASQQHTAAQKTHKDFLLKMGLSFAEEDFQTNLFRPSPDFAYSERMENPSRKFSRFSVYLFPLWSLRLFFGC